MGIDASIYSQYLKPPKSVADYDAEYAQGEANKLNALIGRQNLGLNNLKMDEYKRGVERSNALRDVTGRSATLPADQRINALRVGGFGAEADAAEKSWLERQKAEAEIRSKGIDDAKKRIGMMASSSKFVVDNPSYDSLVAQSRFLIENGLLKPEQAEAALASAKDMTPEQIKAKAMLGFQSAIDADKQLPKTDSANLGGSMSFGATSPITGIRTETGSAPITESANTTATNATRVAEGEKNRAVQMRGQNMTDSRARDRLALDQDKKDNPKPAKPMPASASKLQNEELSAIGAFAGLDADLEGVEKQLAGGKLDPGPINNAAAWVRNNTNNSNEQSRNLASFKSKMENMRNAVLLMNKGVQTEGDATRAMNEIMSNLNDKELVKQRLGEIRVLNKRAVALRKNNIDALRRDYGQEDMDYSKFESRPGATNLPTNGPKPGTVENGYRFKGGNPADKANWEKV